MSLFVGMLASWQTVIANKVVDKSTDYVRIQQEILDE